MQNNNTKFLIIGAGISGLQAANNLAQLNQDFIILQAQNRIGGRICTLTIQQALNQDGVVCPYPWYDKIKLTPVEVGATWVCEEHEQIQKLAQKYQIELHPQYYEGKNILALDEKKKLQLDDYKEYYVPYKEKLMGLVKRLWSLRDRYFELLQLKQQKAITAEGLNELKQMYEIYDGMTCYQFIHNQLQDQFLSSLIANQIQTLQSINPKHFTVMEIFNDDGGWSGIYFYLGLQQYNVDGYRAAPGLSTLITALKNNIQKVLDEKGMNKSINELLKLSHPVVEVRNHLNPVQVVTENGQIFTCRKVLMAVPSGTLGKIKISRLSQGKKLILDHFLTSHTIRLTLVFPIPFWRRLKFSGDVQFSHEFTMHEIVELTPQDESCGILALVFFKQGYAKWMHQIDQQCGNSSASRYEITKQKLLKLIAYMFLEGDINNDCLKECVWFVRSLSYSPYIRNTYDSTTVPGTYKKLFELNQDHLERFNCDEENMVMLGSDFEEVEEQSGYMEGGIRIANRKINKQFVQTCDKS